jgi:UDP:flavonoid glycosyltransferase YjiC (YdhE family)
VVDSGESEPQHSLADRLDRVAAGLAAKGSASTAQDLRDAAERLRERQEGR